MGVRTYVEGPWSDMDLFDLADCVRRGERVGLIADFLCRRPEDVSGKIAELRASGEMQRWIERAAEGVAER